jgi:hypothetical protein
MGLSGKTSRIIIIASCARTTIDIPEVAPTSCWLGQRDLAVEVGGVAHESCVYGLRT